MTAKEAGIIISRMKQGLKFAEDDMIRSEISYWAYDKTKNLFHYERYDTIAGIFLKENFITEDEFQVILETNYLYAEFLEETF